MADVIGTPQPDNLVGTAGNDRIEGLESADIIDAGAGNDLIFSGPGNDRMTGGAGADVFVYQRFDTQTDFAEVITDFTQGDDRIDVSALGIASLATIRQITDDNDNLEAEITSGFGGGFVSLELQGLTTSDLTAADFIFDDSPLSERIVGTELEDDLFGGAGTDALVGLGGSDRLFGESGDDILTPGAGNALLVGGPGADVFVYELFDTFGASNQMVDDFVVGADRIDVSALGISTFETLQALLVDDGAGEQAITAQRMSGVVALQLRGVDFSRVAPGDVVFAPTSSDRVEGTVGNDDLFGGLGDDQLFGLDGNDRLFGGPGSDDLTGARNVDSFIWNPLVERQEGAASVDRVRDFTIGEDRAVVDLSGLENNPRVLTIATAVGDNGVVTTARFEDAPQHRLIIDRITDPTAEGLDPIITSTAERPLIFGTRGDDTVIGSGRDEDISGFGGADDLDGRGGADTISGGDGADLLSGGVGDDFIQGGAGADDAGGGRGGDTINGGAGADRLTGGRGPDRLFGGTGQDNLSGSNGTDLLNGGPASDRLTGGDGDDQFDIDQIGTIPDAITDFLIGADLLVLNDGLGFTLEDLFVVSQNGSSEIRVTSDDTPGGVTVVVLEGILNTSIEQLVLAESLIIA